MSNVTTLSAIEPIALIFKLNNNMVDRSLEGISDEEFWQVAPGGGNPLGWLLGHVAHTRGQILTQIGHPHDSGLGPLFARGAALRDRSEYPSRTAVENAWKESRSRMRDGFASITPERLAGPPPAGSKLPGADTLAGYLAFLAFHESYHVGQMGYVRRRLGHAGIAG
jgi:uncharacterized damage-inducible protein DinB